MEEIKLTGRAKGPELQLETTAAQKPVNSKQPKRHGVGAQDILPGLLLVNMDFSGNPAQQGWYIVFLKITSHVQSNTCRSTSKPSLTSESGIARIPLSAAKANRRNTTKPPKFVAKVSTFPVSEQGLAFSWQSARPRHRAPCIPLPC